MLHITVENLKSRQGTQRNGEPKSSNIKRLYPGMDPVVDVTIQDFSTARRFFANSNLSASIPDI